MPVAIPQTVRRALGEEAVVDFMPWMESWLSESIREKAVPRDEYREVLSRLEGLEKDISLVKDGQTQLRGEYREEQAQLRTEFREEQAQLRAEFRAELGELRREMREGFDHMYARLEQMNQHFESRFEQMNRHFESRFEQMNRHSESHFEQMNRQFESRLDQISQRMLVQTRWLMGTIALFGTILTILMAIAQFTP